MNSGGIASNSGRNGRSYDLGYSSCTINIRTSSTSTTFDKILSTIRPDRTLIVSNSLTTNNINNSLYSSFYPTPCNNGSTSTNQAGSNINLCD
jgi:hypothetical protein